MLIIWTAIKRLWQEVWEPHLKCERVGHKWTRETRRGYRKPDYGEWGFWSYVAFRIREKRTRCVRCGEATPWGDRRESGLTGLTLPSTWMEVLDEDRILWTEVP
jgi:hypothetical protein